MTPVFASLVWEFFTFVFRDLFFPFYRFRYGESESLGKKIQIKFLKKFYLATKTPFFDVFKKTSVWDEFLSFRTAIFWYVVPEKNNILYILSEFCQLAYSRVYLRRNFYDFCNFRTNFSKYFSIVFETDFFRYNRFRYGEYEYVKKKTEIKLLKKFYLGSKTSKSDVFVPKQIFLRNSIAIFSSSDSDSPYQNL